MDKNAKIDFPNEKYLLSIIICVSAFKCQTLDCWFYLPTGQSPLTHHPLKYIIQLHDTYI